MANKGEHSELLALLRILDEGKVQVADSKGNPLPSWLLVKAAILPGAPHVHYEVDGESVHIRDLLTGDKSSVQRSSFADMARHLYSEIKNSKGASFTCPTADKAAELLRITNKKASTTFKSDLTLRVASPVFDGEVIELGFSVKSEIGGMPTLLNAGATKIQYKIVEPDGLSALSVQEGLPRKTGKSFPGPMLLLPALHRQRFDIVFENVLEPSFELNLKMIDTSFPAMIASVIKYAYIEKETNLDRLLGSSLLIDEVSAEVGLSKSATERVLRHKLKDLLRQSALGMNPGTEWEGEIQAHGGWIIVKETGDVVCFHIVNDDDFREYLLCSCKVETPSMSRHQSGYVYKEENGGETRLRLSLQIRFG